MKFQIRQGFTIVELMLYMGLMSILLFVMTDIFVSILGAQAETQQKSAVEQDGRFILSRMSYDIHRVQNKANILLPANLGDSGNTLKLVVNGVTYIYSVDGAGNLNISTDNGVTVDQLNSYGSSVSGMTFQRLGNAGNSNGKDQIKIGFTVSSTVKTTAGVDVKNFNTTLGIR